MQLFDTCVRAFVKGNLGDDLFIDVLCKRYPSTHFWLCGQKKFKSNFSSLSNLTYVCIDNIWIKTLFRGINLFPYIINFFSQKLFHKKIFDRYTCFDFISKHSRHNILISGSIFMELGNSPFKLLPNYKKEQRYFKRAPHVIGCNFGPYHNDEYLEFYSECFKNASYVSFRDEYSYNLFKGNKLNVSPDILFTYQPTSCKMPDITDYVLISVINLAKDGEADAEISRDYMNALSQTISLLMDQGEDIVLMGFCREQQDDRIIHELYEKFQGYSKLYTINYPDISYHEATGYLAASKYIIASRYHAMILGWLFNKKVYPISYNEKMAHVIDELAPQIPYVTTEQLSAFNPTDMVTAINSKDSTFIQYNQAVANAQKHFSTLDQILS